MTTPNNDDMSNENAFYGNIEHVFTKICEDDPAPHAIPAIAETTLAPVEPILPPAPVEPIPEPDLGGVTDAPPFDIVQALWRFKWTMVVTCILVSSTLIWLIWSRTTLQYQARGEVRIRPFVTPLIFNTPENGPIPFYTSFVNTQVSIIRSPNILDPVLERPDIQETAWYQSPKMTLIQKLRGEVPSPYERLRDHLVVEPRRGTEVIDVSLASAVPEDAEIIVNAILDQYLESVGDAASSSNDEVHASRFTQFETFQQEIEIHENRLAELKKNANTEDAQALIASKRVRLDATQTSLESLRQQQKQLQWTLDRQTSQVQGGGSGDANGVGPATPAQPQPKYHLDPEWVRLNGIVMARRHEIETTSYGPLHPNLVDLKNNLRFEEDMLARRERALDEQWRDRLDTVGPAPLFVPGGPTAEPLTASAGETPLLSPADQIELLKYQERELQADYRRQQEEYQKLFDTVQLIDKETRELAHKREMFDAVRDSLDRANVERGRPGSIEILMRAIAPTEPFQDRRIAFSFISLILGIGLGGSVALIRAQQNQTIYTPKDLPMTMREPFLGKLPMIRTKRLLGNALWQEIEQNEYLMVEPIRVMRTILLSRLSAQGHSNVLISSAKPGTGKSSFAVLLGRSLAEAGKRVLLIDTDVHQKTLSKRFNLEDHAGFFESMRDKGIDRNVIVETETQGLSILPAGRAEKDRIAQEQIANGALQDCLDQISSELDIDLIVLDSPAILTIANTIIMANQVDGTIMVERERISHRGDVARALARLASSGGRLLGTVFVGSQKNENASGASGYGYGGATQLNA